MRAFELVAMSKMPLTTHKMHNILQTLSFKLRHAIWQFCASAPKGSVIHGYSTGERGTGRLWSWAQHARRVSFRRLTMRYLFDAGGKRTSTSLTTSKMPGEGKHGPTSSPGRETDSPMVDCKQSPAFHSIYRFQS